MSKFDSLSWQEQDALVRADYEYEQRRTVRYRHARQDARSILAGIGLTGYRQRHRIDALAAVLADHPNAWVERCSDERTGARYGEARCRAGRCKKIGRTTYRYQLWAVWAD